jgi:hypothetical protein
VANAKTIPDLKLATGQVVALKNPGGDMNQCFALLVSVGG